ncbi:MAG: glycogen synthase GlgA [Thermodesulfovibrionales bacterium]
MKVLIAASEAAPFAKTGGLADVTGSLLKEFPALKVTARLFLPLYRGIRERFDLRDTGVAIKVPVGRKKHPSRVFSFKDRVFFLECDEFFDRSDIYGTPEGEYKDNAQRFVFYSRGVLEACAALGYEPDVIHCNDWQTGLIPMYVRTLYKRHFEGAATLLTIHNLGYQGVFPASAMTLTGLPHGLFNPEAVEFFGQVNFLKAGIVAADAISAVSENYAREITTREYGFGLDGVLRNRAGDITGILNGLDYGQWDPASDGFLPAGYGPEDLGGKKECRRRLVKECGFKDEDAPVVGMVGRLASQKGLELFLEAAGRLFGLGLNVVMLGRGEEHLHVRLAEAERLHPGRFSLHIGYDEALAHRVYAGSDVFAIPSRYEPCGLTQMIALKYGTPPVARATGGLADTIRDYDHLRGEGTGFLFADYNASAFEECIKRALCLWRDGARWEGLMRRGMGRDFSWRDSARKYAALYGALARRSGR